MIVLAPDFMTNLCNKAAEHFHYAEPKVFTIGKSVAIWSGNIKKNKDLKSYGSAAMSKHIDYWTDDYTLRNEFFYSY